MVTEPKEQCVMETSSFSGFFLLKSCCTKGNVRSRECELLVTAELAKEDSVSLRVFKPGRHYLCQVRIVSHSEGSVLD